MNEKKSYPPKILLLYFSTSYQVCVRKLHHLARFSVASVQLLPQTQCFAPLMSHDA
jgi:hypothetical protein